MRSKGEGNKVEIIEEVIVMKKRKGVRAIKQKGKNRGKERKRKK